MGIGLFGTFTAFVAKIFIEPNQKHEEDRIADVKKQLADINAKVDLLINNANKK